MHTRRTDENGSSLADILVAIVLLGIGVAGLLNVWGTSISLSLNGRETSTIAAIAVSAGEAVRDQNRNPYVNCQVPAPHPPVVAGYYDPRKGIGTWSAPPSTLAPGSHTPDLYDIRVTEIKYWDGDSFDDACLDAGYLRHVCSIAANHGHGDVYERRTGRTHRRCCEAESNMIRTRIVELRQAALTEAGTTLVELIVGMVVLAIIGAATIGSLFQLLSTERTLNDRASVASVGDMLAVSFAADVAGSDGKVEDSNDPTAGNSTDEDAWACASARPTEAKTLIRLRQVGHFEDAETTRFIHYIREPSPDEVSATRVVRYACPLGGPITPSDTLIVARRVKVGENTAGGFTTDGTDVIRATLRIEAMGSNGLTNRTSVTGSPRVAARDTLPLVTVLSTAADGGNDDGSGDKP